MEKCPSASMCIAIAILILVVASVQSVKGETFYIVTTPGSPFCNESGSERTMHGSGVGPQRCLTLQQFVKKFISNELSPTNLTLELEPGEHILDSNLTMTTVVSFAMISEAATINCTAPIFRYFLLYSLEDVLISGITLIDCGWLGVYNTSHFRFENSSFYESMENDHGNRYSLELESVTEVAIIGSTFFQNNYSGQLFVGNGSMIRIQECTFTRINAYERVIYSVDSTTLTIDGCTFENIILDERNDHGTAVEVVNNQESVTVTNCDFNKNNIGNRLETQDQGLFSIDGRGSVVIRGNRFTQNTGRVLSINNVNEITIDQNSFIDNAGPGAALNINARSVPLVISRNNLTRNTDGAINLLVSDSNVTINDCSFSGNTKNENGGAAMTVYEHDHKLNGWGNVKLNISQSSFYNNSVIANGSGGALHIGIDSSWSTVLIKSSIFSNNRAPQAGALYINASANTTCGTIMTTFDNNMATEGHAGAVAINIYTGEVQHSRSVYLWNSNFTNNTAPHGCAGAVYIDDASTLLTGSIFLNNSAHNCGALALNSGRIEIGGSNFLSNRATNDGGVICTSADMRNVSIIIGNFSDNQAERNGGVMIIEPPTNEHYGHKSVPFDIGGNSYFYNNSAGSQGGVFATFSRSDFHIDISFFFENQAGIEGGVMYVTDTNSSVSLNLDNRLGFNRAGKRGGVISINGSSLFIGAIDIFNNSADMGAVISACSSNVSLSLFPHMLYQYNDPNFPNCLLYDENEPSTEAVTTPTIPPTGAKHLNSGLAVAIAVPVVLFLVLALIIAAALAYACYPKCKKSVSGRYGVKKSETDDPDSAPLMGNA